MFVYMIVMICKMLNSVFDLSRVCC